MTLPDTDPTRSPTALLRHLEASLATMSPRDGVALLDAWRDRLANLDLPAMHELAARLDGLRQVLAAPSPDPATVGHLLASLGEATRQATPAAEDAPTRRVLARLGDFLFHSGHALLNRLDTPSPR